jgi:hypothetical protein
MLTQCVYAGELYEITLPDALEYIKTHSPRLMIREMDVQTARNRIHQANRLQNPTLTSASNIGKAGDGNPQQLVVSEVIEKETPVSEEVVRQMVIGANELFGTDYSVAISGFAGPGGPDGGRSGVLVGTIWIAVGCKDNIVTRMIEEDNGRDKNLASATSVATHMLLEYLKENCPKEEEIETE